VHQAGRLSEALRARGLQPVEVPVLEIQPPLSFHALDAALCELSSFDWLIVTSANTVEALVARATTLHVDFTACRAQIAAVGEATAKAVRKANLQVALIPEKYVAESLVAALAEKVEGKRILLAKAELARDVIPAALQVAGATLVVADAYRNGMPSGAPEQLRQVLAAGINAATFTSSSSVTHLADAAQAANIAFPFADVKAISIGPITSATLLEAGWEPAAEADPSDIPGLVEAVAGALNIS
jgi:uroporphyrinogen-III synthase